MKKIRLCQVNEKFANHQLNAMFRDFKGVYTKYNIFLRLYIVYFFKGKYICGNNYKNQSQNHLRKENVPRTLPAKKINK